MENTVSSEKPEQIWEIRERERKALIGMSRHGFDKMMVNRFPDIFINRHKPMTETCMYWGFDVGAGWYPILLDLCIKLDTLCRLTGIKVIAEQVKEKFATLRFYFSLSTVDGHKMSPEEVKIIEDIVFDLVGMADSRSAQTCDVCGESGEIRTSLGWWRTLCDEHYEQDARKRGISPRNDYND